MSYAQAAAKGPEQSPEEESEAGLALVYMADTTPSRAPPPPEVVKTESGSPVSLLDVDSPHVAEVPPGYEDQKVKTTTQAERLEREAEQSRLEEDKKKAAVEAKKAKSKAKDRAASLRRNKDNPVILGNAFLVAAISAGLGFGAYKKHAEGKLSWELAGIWAGAVGALATADYFVSKWLFQNKYPRK